MGKLKHLKMVGLGRKYSSPTKITHLFSSQPNNLIIQNFPYFLLSIFHPLTNNPMIHTYPMFGLREGNRREEKTNKGEGKNVGSSDRFLNNINSLSFLLCYLNSWKKRRSKNSLHFPPLPLKSNSIRIIEKKEKEKRKDSLGAKSFT